MRLDTREDAFIAYINTSRNNPIKYKYRDVIAVRKLKELKEYQDLDSYFTKELL